MILVGRDFFAGYRIAILISASFFLFGIGWFCQLSMLFHKRSFLVATIFFVACAFNIGANWVFISAFGYVAAAYVSVASHALLALSMRYMSRRYFAWVFPWKSFLKISLIALGTFAFMRFAIIPHCPSSWGVCIGGGLLCTLCYWLSAVLCKEFSPSIFKKMIT